MSYKSKYTGEQVENLLGKAGTSLQSSDISRVATTGNYNDLSNKPTIPDISGKQDILVSGTNIKTINGESILGSGDITIEGGNGDSGVGVYSEVNHGTSDTTFTLTPNTFHVWGEVTSLDLSLGDATSGVMNEYIFQFTSGSTATTLTLPDDIKWTEDIVIESNMIYQISIVNGLGAVLEFSAINSVMPITLYALSSGQGMNYTNPPSDNPNANKLYEELMSLSNNTGQGNLDIGLVTLVLRVAGVAGSTQTNNITSYSLAPSYVSEGILLLQQGFCYYVLQQDGTIQSRFYD